ncbi:MAG: sulfatase-like hydrolase/transferase [Bacillota bacterium]|nr:sulfatase-like hydrolase/transferase [Bacillota bacterium]
MAGFTGDRPNILFIMTDQQKASAAGGVYGSPIVQTPLLDRLAADGITFTQAYANSPICTPSRATMMTGVHPLVHQVTCHQNRMPHNLVQMPELLQQQGYYTAVCGHYERTRNLTRGWHEQVDFNEPGPLYHTWHHAHQHGRSDVGWSSGQIDVPAEHGHSAMLTDRAMLMLDQIELSGKPFFFHVPYIDPHPPYFVPRPFDTLYDPAVIALPPAGDDAGRPLWQVAAMEDCATAAATEFDKRKVIAIYYGMITYANRQMLRLYDEMDRRGLLDNTWVIATSDHGDYTGEKGLYNKTESLYECLLHVPLVIRPPRGTALAGPSIVNDLVQLADLFPTILRLAGASVPEYAQGCDLVDWIRSGNQKPLHDYIYAQVGDYQGHLKTTFPGGIPEHGRRKCLVQAIRSPRYLYIQDEQYGDEAYDLFSDPYELHSLLRTSGSLPPELRVMKDRLVQWRETCLKLRQSLGIIPGDRGFWEGVAL